MVRESVGSLASQWPPSDPAGSYLDAAVAWFLPPLRPTQPAPHLRGGPFRARHLGENEVVTSVSFVAVPHD